ncbi:MAG TPA: ATP-binding protein [Thermoleophilaceae bacterium]
MGATESSAGRRSFRRSFRPELGAAAEARRELEDLFPAVDDDLLDRSRLVLTEVITNSVKHARLTPSQPIDVQAALLTAVLRIEVTDDGIGFLPPATSPERGSAAGGWGLWLIDQLADRWGVDCSHSTRVWVEFDRGRSTAPRVTAPAAGPRRR